MFRSLLDYIRLACAYLRINLNAQLAYRGAFFSEAIAMFINDGAWVLFWVFFFTFGGGAGFALTKLGSSSVIAGVGAGVIGWIAGALAVTVIRSMSKHSASSELAGAELVGSTGTLLLPASPAAPGKVRVEIKGRAEDFVANVVEDGGNLPTGTTVLIVAEGERGSLLVTKHEM